MDALARRTGVVVIAFATIAPGASWLRNNENCEKKKSTVDSVEINHVSKLGANVVSVEINRGSKLGGHGFSIQTNLMEFIFLITFVT